MGRTKQWNVPFLDAQRERLVNNLYIQYSGMIFLETPANDKENSIMYCKNTQCNGFIEVTKIQYPNEDSIYPFPVAKCPHCHLINMITVAPDHTVWAEKIVTEDKASWYNPT